MKGKVSTDLLEKWLKAWSLSRNLPLPIQYTSGFKVEVGDEKQKERYVFSEPDENFLKLSRTLEEPWVYLKVCTAPDHFLKSIPNTWELQPQGYMMSCHHPMNISNPNLPDGYRLEKASNHSVFTIRIIAEDEEQAAIGRVVLVDGLAVYDRIVTEKGYRRKGLGSFLMKELEKLALSRGVSNNLLVATEEGKLLYESLGWEVYSLYTSIVIPGKE